MSEKPHFSAKAGKHLTPLTAAPSTRTTLAHPRQTHALQPNKSGMHNKSYGPGNGLRRGKTEKALSHAKGVQAALKISPPVITSLKGGETFVAPARLKLASRHAYGKRITYELQKKDKSGIYRLFKKSLSGVFGGLEAGFYRVRAIYDNRGLPAGRWVAFRIKDKLRIRKIPSTSPRANPNKIMIHKSK